MNSERKGKNIVIAVLLASVLCLSVAFAANIGTNLKVEGNATIVTPKWDVSFTNIENVVKPTAAADPTISANGTLVSYTVTLEVGQTYSFNAVVKNGGTFNAKLNNYSADEVPAWLAPYVEYSVTGLTQDDVIAPNGVKTLAVSLKVKDITDQETLTAFQEALNTNGTSVTLNVQADFVPES